MSETQQEELRRVAWEVEIDGRVAITFAPTRSAAKFNAVHGYRRAEFIGPREWPSSVRARRVPRFDRSTLRDQGRRKCYIREYVEVSVP